MTEQHEHSHQCGVHNSGTNQQTLKATTDYEIRPDIQGQGPISNMRHQPMRKPQSEKEPNAETTGGNNSQQQHNRECHYTRVQDLEF